MLCYFNDHQTSDQPVIKITITFVDMNILMSNMDGKNRIYSILLNDHIA